MRLSDHAGKYVRRQGDVTGIGEQVIIMGSKKSPVTCARNVTASWKVITETAVVLSLKVASYTKSPDLGKVPALAADIRRDREK